MPGNVAQPRGARGKFWTGVLNNYSEAELNALCQLDCRELLVAKEIGSENGTPHLHMYMRFEKSQYLSHLKRICERAHWEVVRDRGACIEYCSKQGEVVVSRLLSESPERPSLAGAIECMKAEGFAGCARAFPEVFVRHSRGLQALLYATIEYAERPVP